MRESIVGDTKARLPEQILESFVVRFEPFIGYFEITSHFHHFPNWSTTSMAPQNLADALSVLPSRQTCPLILNMVYSGIQ